MFNKYSYKLKTVHTLCSELRSVVHCLKKNQFSFIQASDNFCNGTKKNKHTNYIKSSWYNEIKSGAEIWKATQL